MLAGLVGRVYMGCERFKGWNLFESCQIWLKILAQIMAQDSKRIGPPRIGYASPQR